MAYNWLLTYLSNRKQYVSYQNKSSKSSNVQIGVPQGSILGPLLFLVYINDLNNAILSGALSLFADDANYYQSSRECFELIQTINNNLKQLSKWFVANHLSLNNLKSEAMLFSRKIIYFPMPPIMIDNTPISYNYIFKFLGLWLDFKLNWKQHINHVRSKLACGIIYRLRNKINIQISKLIYYCIAFPYINYCSIVWSSAHPTNMQKIFSTQRKLIRLMLRKQRRTQTSHLFSNLKILKACDVFKVNTLLFVFKAVNSIIPSPLEFVERAPNLYNLRARPPLQVPNHTSQQSERFIHVRGTRLWNEIPESLRRSPSVFSFKRKLKKGILDSYN